MIGGLKMTDEEMVSEIQKGIDCFNRVVDQLRFQPQRRMMEFKINDIIKETYGVMRQLDTEPLR